MLLEKRFSRCLPSIVLALTVNGPRLFPQETDLDLFIRGDANRDHRVDLSDAISTLEFLFLATQASLCFDAADSDDSGALDISDPILTLGFLFLGHEQLPDPFPDPGFDLTQDPLGCFSSPVDETLGAELEPARPLNPAELEAEDLRSESMAAFASVGASEVSGEVFDLLESLVNGASLNDLRDVPGTSGFLDEVFCRLPRPDAPLALPAELISPAGTDGCYNIDAYKLRGNSLDTGADPTPREALILSVDPEHLCGLGRHIVRVTVTDTDGLESAAMTTVTLCDSSDDSCREKTTVSPNSVAAGEGPMDSLYCVWRVVPEVIPSANTESITAYYYDGAGNTTRVRRKRPVVFGPEAMQYTVRSNGAGPNHFLILGRSSPNCNTTAADWSLIGSGRYRILANVTCYDAGGNFVSNPPCSADVDVEATYRARVLVETHAGGDCGGRVNPVETLAQEETLFTMNDSIVFNKAIALLNGNDVRTTIGYQLQGNFGVNGKGLAANIGVTIGHTQLVWRNTGRKADFLRATGNMRVGVPVTARLDCEGKAALRAENAADGMAIAHSEIAAMFAVGTTDCPGAQIFGMMLIAGQTTALEETLRQARDFFYTRTGSDDLFLKLMEAWR